MILYGTAAGIAFIIWALMLIDAIKTKRTKWLLLIILLPAIGAIIYAIAIKLRKQEQPQTPEPQQPVEVQTQTQAVEQIQQTIQV